LLEDARVSSGSAHDVTTKIWSDDNQ